MLNKQSFNLNEQAPVFEYNGRTRSGKVERVTDKFVTLELDFDHYNPPNKFKSFRFEKMVRVG